MMDKINSNNSSSMTANAMSAISGRGAFPSVGSKKSDEASSVGTVAKSKPGKAGAADAANPDEAAFAAALTMLTSAHQPQIQPVVGKTGGYSAEVGEGKDGANERGGESASVLPASVASKGVKEVAEPALTSLSGEAIPLNPIVARNAKAMLQAEAAAAGKSAGASNPNLTPLQALAASPLARPQAGEVNPGAVDPRAIEMTHSTNTATARAGLNPGIAEAIRVPERGTADAAVAIEHLKQMRALPVEISNAQTWGVVNTNPSLQSQAQVLAMGTMGQETGEAGAGLGLQPKVAGKDALSGGDFLKMRNLVQFSGTGQGLGVQASGQSGQKKSGFDSSSEGNGGGKGFGDPNRTLAGASSGTDGMNLQALHGDKPFGLATAAGPAVIQSQAHVTQGGMAKDRLSSESLVGLGMNIRNLAPQGGGEIHIKLQPENLGELHLRVVTDGNQVGLRIQASDDRARKILETSLSSLQDSLASHQLSLKSVEFTVAQAGSAQGEFRGGHEQSQPQHTANNPWSPSQQGFRGDSQAGREGFAERAGSSSLGSGGAGLRGFAGSGGMAATGARTRAAASNGRLDVMA
jgi:flagellar hook-length control protein FliK